MTTRSAQTTQVASKKPKSGNKLNMIIARTHQLSSRLVGMQLTSGTFIAVMLSMAQMSLGFLFISSGMTHGLWYMVTMVVLLGCLLAILVERLSIGGLSAVREAKEKKRIFVDRFYAKAEKREPSTYEKENKERKVKEFDKDIKAGWWFGGAGMVISVALGDVFWHQLFESLNWLSYPLSLACAAVITLTFIHSELFQKMVNRVLRGILREMQLMKVAVTAETENMQLDMLSSAMATVRDDENVRLPIEAKLGRVVVKRLSGFADDINGMSIDEEDVIEGEVTSVKQIAAPRTKGEYAKRRAELRQYLSDNPGATVSQVAEHFKKSKSTMQDWLNKNRAGL
jgi:hypothetical protein